MTRGPVSRRERPAKPALTREWIVATAFELVQSEGLHRLTMRRLAQHLDTGAASLYVYVRDIEELHAAVLDLLLAEVDTTVVEPPVDRPDASGRWRERLWSLTRSYIHVLYEQPALARVALVTRLSGPHYLAIVDAALGLLAQAGLDAARASWAVDALLLLATATAVEQGTRAGTPNAEQQHEALIAEVEAAQPQELPHIAALGHELFSGPGAGRTRWAFDALLNGALTTTTS